MENPIGKNVLQDQITSLESLLVKQFRNLQNLVQVTKKERAALSKGDAIALVPLVEEKKTLLEQMSVLEDSTLMVRDEIARSLGMDAQNTPLLQILDQISSPVSENIKRLREGILTLYDECRDLNMGNRALAQNAIDWLGSAQQFLLECYSAPEGYDSFGRKPTSEAVVFRNRGQEA
mgnify:CR=1 FL=1